MHCYVTFYVQLWKVCTALSFCSEPLPIVGGGQGQGNVIKKTKRRIPILLLPECQVWPPLAECLFMSSALLNVQHMPDVQLEAAISTTIIAKMHRKKGTILLYTGSCCRVSALSLECSEFKSKAKSDKWDCRNPATATKSHLTFTKKYTLYIFIWP